MSNQMSKHTPGPWFVTGNMTLYVEARIGGGLVQEVAAVGPTEADSGYGPQQRANADLIAAAPDLLEALTQCRAELLAMIDMHNQQDEDDGSWLYDYQTVVEADAAIAKARGEA
jgi:hypothetical protein